MFAAHEACAQKDQSRFCHRFFLFPVTNLFSGNPLPTASMAGPQWVDPECLMIAIVGNACPR